MRRYTKIIGTLGPCQFIRRNDHQDGLPGDGCGPPEFSHGTHAQHQAMIDLVRKVNPKKKFSRHDLAGPGRLSYQDRAFQKKVLLQKKMRPGICPLIPS